MIQACVLRGQDKPIKITIYSHDSSSTTQINSKPFLGASVSKNLFKWNYSLIARGIIMLNYERQLTEKITFEVGGGLTYSDFFFTTYYDLGGLVNNTGYSTTNTNTGITTIKSLVANPFENSTKKIGFALEASPRYYFNKDEFEGFFISPYLSYRKYNYSLMVDLPNVSSNGNNSEFFDDLSYSFVDLGGKIGYQRYLTLNDAFYYDLYIGFAYRKANILTLQKTETGYTNSGISSTTYSEYLQTLGLLQVMLGAKIGFVF